MHIKTTFMKALLPLLTLMVFHTVSLFATDYHVGPQQTYATIQAVPWDNLTAGDKVYIHYRADAYKEKIVLRGQGTANAPISIIGIPGPNGEMPVLDGAGAVSSASNYYSTANNSLNLRSLIVVSRGANDPFTYKPQHIVIEGLEIKNAHPSFSYLEDGNTLNYIDAAAGVYIDAGDHITIKNCKIHHCANAIFANSRAAESQVSRDILIEGNHFYQCGVAGSYLRHTTYVQAINATYQYNFYDDMLAGALGNPLKDRSAGTVIRYNWIVAHAQALDLVETQEGAPLTLNEAAYRETFVYGNLIHNKPQGATYLIHYGGEGYDYSTYRRGKLYFYHNTVINQSDVTSRYRVVLFRLPLDAETTESTMGNNLSIEESVFAYNNIIYNEAATPGQSPSNLVFLRVDEAASVEAGVNWVSPSVSQSESLSGFAGTIQGWNNVVQGSATNDPGFVNISQEDFRLRTDAIARNLGDPLPATLQERHPVDQLYVKHSQHAPSSAAPNSPGLGAFETALSGTNYYVSNAGNDNNSGLSEAEAFLTLQKAADVVQAGDTTFVLNGTYTGFDLRNTNGTSAAPIVFTTLGDQVLINQSGPIRNDGINIENADYVVIDGFEVVGMSGNGNGIRVVLSDHCVVRNSSCDQNAERGIFTAFTDDILIEYNTCTNSVDEHGIYVSNSSDRPIIRFNTCYGNNNIGIHMNGDLSAGGDGIISDAQVYGNTLYDNNLAAGINMDGLENPIVYNNLIFNNHSAQGIALFQQDGAIPTRGAKVYNNTILVPEDGRWGILMTAGANEGTEIYNNIIINQHAWRGCISAVGTNGLSSDFNLLNDRMSASGDGSAVDLATWQALNLDLNSLNITALTDVFVDFPNRDFHLKPTSQAIDRGTNAVASIVAVDLDNKTRPMGSAYDIGAYEFDPINSTDQTLQTDVLFTIYPNPTASKLLISKKEPMHIEAIHLVDQAGKLVKQWKGFTQNQMELDISTVPASTYFIHLIGRGNYWTKQISIVR